MPQVCFDESRFRFPDVSEADGEGLLLIGGKVTAQRVLEAYKKGIFPWYEGDELPLWWSPNPRFVLFPGDLHISRSMQKLLAKNTFVYKTNTAFEQVMNACASVKREGQTGTWITKDIKDSYRQLHYDGYAHSIEAWLDDKLVGGMYGLQIGNVFFGESMFSKHNNASKFAFIQFVKQLKQQGTQLIDCQVYTSHVESLGAKLIERTEYLRLLKQLIPP